MKTVFVASLNFSPGHYSHMKAFYKLFEEMSFESYLYVDRGYEPFLVSDNGYRHIYSDTESAEIKPDLVIFENPAVRNHRKAQYFKKNCGSKIIYIYHEPWDGINNYFNEDFKQFIKFAAAHYFSIKLIKLCDYVLLPSNRALANYKKYDIWANERAAFFPLIFDDECKHDCVNMDKKYFSFIGHAIESHQFGKYIEFIKYSLDNNLDFKFLIASRSNIDSVINDPAIKEAIANKRIKIINKKILNNEEINKCFEESFCVWNLYKRSTQSGVLPKAFMFGTPVIASSTGSFEEYVVDRENGIVLNADAGFDEISRAAAGIKDSRDFFSANARNTFEKKFHYGTNKSSMQCILKHIYRATLREDI